MGCNKVGTEVLVLVLGTGISTNEGKNDKNDNNEGVVRSVVTFKYAKGYTVRISELGADVFVRGEKHNEGCVSISSVVGIEVRSDGGVVVGSDSSTAWGDTVV